MTPDVAHAYDNIALSLVLFVITCFAAKWLEKIVKGKYSKVNVRLLKIGSIGIVTDLSFNLLYSWYFGFDHVYATSTIEWILDIFTALLYLLFLMFVVKALFTSKKTNLHVKKSFDSVKNTTIYTYFMREQILRFQISHTKKDHWAIGNKSGFCFFIKQKRKNGDIICFALGKYLIMRMNRTKKLA